MPPEELQTNITLAFLKELEAFQNGGYKFDGSDRELFPGTQREAFDAYVGGIKSGHTEGYYEIPTGVGKTALFIAIIGCYLRATANIQNAPRVIIHEPTVDLITQTALSFADFMPDIAKTIEADDEQGREIDWENSKIDIHYTGRKGAKNNPKVLITTYQSQAADERKSDLAEKTYKSEDFGLAIHDEAHFLTGEKYGPAAVDKFHGALQLGVTATPEYSLSKTVANKLGHRYYHLPLLTAIERGDLCHVRPLILKTTTSTKIDLQKAKDFLERRYGLPLTNAQLERLLNQEARNQAIIKSYLTGEHPDTTEQFLGQTGMIFAGGITHCNDFVRDTYKVLDKPAYQEVKRWLRDEGLCLIAPIHSDIPKEGVEIILGGEKKQCTKDEIKELHRQGKLLLIISDQELKLGSDFPRDSYIADAIDRFSVPDATQRMGRGFRIDRPNARYDWPGNLDKSCAAINVIDETTHAMYKGTPYYPIHAIEILQGAEFRPPVRKKESIRRFRHHPPKISESLEELGFEFVTKTEAIKAIATQFTKNKKQIFPEKTDDWWSPQGDIARKIGGNTNATKLVVTQIISAFESGTGAPQSDGSTLIIFENNTYHVQRMRAGMQSPICIYKDDVINAGLVWGDQPLPKKTADWWTTGEIRAQPGGQTTNTRAIVSQITTAFEAGQGQSQPDSATLVTIEDKQYHVQKMQFGMRAIACILSKDVLKAGLVWDKLPQKTAEWWTAGEIAQQPGGGTNASLASVQQIVTMYEAGTGQLQSDGSILIAFEGNSYQVQRMQSGVQAAICIRKEHIIKAGLVLDKPLPQKTETWWTLSVDIIKKPGGATNKTRSIISEITKAFEAGTGTLLPDGTTLINMEGNSYHVQRMQAGPTSPVCILNDDIIKAGLIRTYQPPKKTEDWWSGSEIGDQPGGQKLISRSTVPKIIKSFEAGEGELLADGSTLITVDDKSYHVQRMLTGGSKSIICIQKKGVISAGLVSEKVLPKKTADWWSLNDIFLKPSGGANNTKTIVSQIFNAFEAEEGELQADDSRLIVIGTNSYRVQQMRSMAQTPACIQGQDLIKAGLVLENTLPQKTDDWWTITDILAKPGGGSNNTKSIVSQIFNAFEAGTGELQPDGSTLIAIESNTYHVQKMQTGSQLPLCIWGEDIIKAELVLKKPLPKKTDDWWSSSDLFSKPGGGSANTQSTFSQIIGAFEAGTGELQPDGSTLIIMQAKTFHVQKMTTGGHQIACIPSEDIIKAGLLCELPKKTDSWWSPLEIRRKPGGGTNISQSTVSQIVSVFEAGTGELQPDGSTLITIESKKYHAQKMRIGSQSPICIQAEDIIKAGLVLEKPLPVKTDEWWTKYNISKLPRGNFTATQSLLSRIIAAFEEGAGELQPDGSTLITIESKSYHTQRMRAGLVPAVCIRSEDIINAGLIMLSHNRDELKAKPIQPKNIRPESEALKRTDISPGKTE